MKLVVFDIDGTLTDTNGLSTVCFKNAWEEFFDFSIENVKWEDIVHFSDTGITKQCFKMHHKNRIPEALFRAYKAYSLNRFDQTIAKAGPDFQEIKGARHFFNLLNDHPDFEVGVATGSWERSGIKKLDAIQIPLQGVPYGNSDHHISRAGITRSAIDQAKQKSKAAYEEIIYFGDGVWDFHTCKEVDIRFIGIDNQASGKLEALGAKEVFKDYTQPEAILSVL